MRVTQSCHSIYIICIRLYEVFFSFVDSLFANNVSYIYARVHTHTSLRGIRFQRARAYIYVYVCVRYRFRFLFLSFRSSSSRQGVRERDIETMRGCVRVLYVFVRVFSV